MRAEVVRLAVLGDPLTFTLSPALHRAGLESIGMACESRAIRTAPESLGQRLERLAGEGYRGVNLTAPLKQAALSHLARVSETARRARSVNTVGFAADGAWGETTDGAGLLALLRSLGRDATRARVLLLGAGGSARSLALALASGGCGSIAVCARAPESARPAWSDIPPVAWIGWDSNERAVALSEATLILHCTPLDDPELPLEDVRPGTAIMDLRYGGTITPWVARARAAGLEAWDGLGLLVFQAQLSLSLWTGTGIAIDPLARAVGWPR